MTALINALGSGDIKGFIAYLAIFAVLWLEIRGLRKAVKNLGDSISNGFQAGEKRFEQIESQANKFEHRLTVLEQNRGVIS